MAATSKDGTPETSFKCGKHNGTKIMLSATTALKFLTIVVLTRVGKCNEQKLVISSASDRFAEELSTASIADYGLVEKY